MQCRDEVGDHAPGGVEAGDQLVDLAADGRVLTRPAGDGAVLGPAPGGRSVPTEVNDEPSSKV